MTPEKIPTIVECCTWIRISLGAATSDTFKKCHGTADFEKIIENIKEFVRVRKNMNKTISIGLSMMVHPDNYHELYEEAKLAKKLGVDYLNSARPPGLIFLQGDTGTFITQYYYYVEKAGYDNKLVMTGRLKHLSYRQKLIREYPGVYYPQGFGEQENINFNAAVSDFISENSKKFEIYSIEKLPLSDDYIWIREGMLVKLYRKTEEPSAEQLGKIIEEKLENLTFTPEVLEGHYINFFEDNLRAIYGRVYLSNALELSIKGSSDKAIPYFLAAKELSPSSEEVLYGLGTAYLEKRDCDMAASEFRDLVELDEDYWQAWEGLGKVYQDCLDDSEKAWEFFERARSEQEKKESTPL